MSIKPSVPALTVRAIKATPVEVPLNFVLGTSQAAVRKAPLLLIDLETEEGITGRGYLFAYVRAAAFAIVNLIAEIESLAAAGAFDAIGRPPACVVLVDDVFTTGATLSAAATALRAAGAERVEAVTFARAAELV